jgi:small GTP-binding protein
LGLWDTAGQEDYDRLRPLSYPGTDVFLLCFSLVNANSLQNALSKWCPEIRHHCPDTPIVLVGTKAELRNDRNTQDRLANRGETMPTQQEIDRIAQNIGAQYVETSAREMRGLNECFTTAIRSIYSGKSEKKKSGGLFSRKKTKDYVAEKTIRHPPELPKPKSHAPVIPIDTSTYAEGLATLVRNEKYSDMELVHGDDVIPCHRIILAGSSAIFRKILIEKTISVDDINEGKLLPFKQAEINNERFRIVVNDELVDRMALDRVVEFLYTGSPVLAKEHNLDKVDEAAQIFELQELSNYIANIRNNDPDLNPSIGTYLNDELASALLKLFFNQELFSDVQFMIEDKVFYGHKAILSCNCPVMSTMLNSGFSESENNIVTIDDYDYESYKAFLEYLYTAHAPLADSTAVSILTICNQYSLSRPITLCELYISKIIEKEIVQGIEKADIDIIELLLVAQDHNAKKLAEFCLHFICTNYQPMKKRKEFEKLENENLTYIEENQWPPVSYWKELAEYEKEMGIKDGVGTETVNDKKCLIM